MERYTYVWFLGQINKSYGQIYAVAPAPAVTGSVTVYAEIKIGFGIVYFE